MSEQIIIPAAVLQTIKGDLEAITQAMSDLYIACNDGKLARVAPHIVEHVGKLSESIKDSLSDCEIEAKEPGTIVGFERWGFHDDDKVLVHIPEEPAL